MQLTKTIFFDSAIFIEKKNVEISCGQKVNFVGGKKISLLRALSLIVS